jgi:hypothetical protein
VGNSSACRTARKAAHLGISRVRCQHRKQRVVQHTGHLAVSGDDRFSAVRLGGPAARDGGRLRGLPVATDLKVSIPRDGPTAALEHPGQQG